MATKKNTPNKVIKEKSTIYKIGGRIGQMAVGMMAGKDKLVEVAGGAIESVKSVIENINANKKIASKKAEKTVIKKPATKSPRVETKKLTKADTTKKSISSKKTKKPAAVKKPVTSKKPTKTIIKKSAASKK